MTEALKNTTRVSEALTRAVQPVFMPGQIFAHLIRSLRAEVAATAPKTLQQLLWDLGHPLLSAAQAGEVLATLQAKGDVNYQIFHVLCSRVVDRWNLNAKTHGIGHCYYGLYGLGPMYSYYDDLVKLLYPSDTVTLGGVLWLLLERMGRDSFKHSHSNFWNERMNGFVMGQVREHNALVGFEAAQGIWGEGGRKRAREDTRKRNRRRRGGVETIDQRDEAEATRGDSSQNHPSSQRPN